MRSGTLLTVRMEGYGHEVYYWRTRVVLISKCQPQLKYATFMGTVVHIVVMLLRAFNTDPITVPCCVLHTTNLGYPTVWVCIFYRPCINPLQNHQSPIHTMTIFGEISNLPTEGYFANKRDHASGAEKNECASPNPLSGLHVLFL